MEDVVSDDARESRLRLWQTGLPYRHRAPHCPQGGLDRAVRDSTVLLVPCRKSAQGMTLKTELLLCPQVLCMTREEFSEFKDNEGWEEDEEDEEKVSFALSNEGLPGLKASWKFLIHEAARLTVRSYGDGEVDKGEMKGGGVDSDLALMENKTLLAGLSSRQKNALQLRCGQKTILHRLMELTKS